MTLYLMEVSIFTAPVEIELLCVCVCRAEQEARCFGSISCSGPFGFGVRVFFTKGLIALQGSFLSAAE